MLEKITMLTLVLLIPAFPIAASWVQLPTSQAVAATALVGFAFAALAHRMWRNW